MTAPNLLLEWEQAKAALDAAKTAELLVRNELIATHHPAVLPEGTTTIKDLTSGNENDVTLVISQPFNYKIDRSFPPKWAASAVIRTKYELDKKAYNLLDPKNKKELQRWMTIKPGQPGVKVNHSA